MALRLPLASHVLGANGNKNVFQTLAMTPRTRCRVPRPLDGPQAQRGSLKAQPHQLRQPQQRPGDGWAAGRLGRRGQRAGRTHKESENASACAISEGSVW